MSQQALNQLKAVNMGIYGNMCGPGDTGELCIEPIFQAGWPLPFVFDIPTISVPMKLHFEDEFNFGFFALDVAFFASFLNVVWRLNYVNKD